MKIILWLGAVFSLAFACSGDCASCHYRLDYQHDTRHAPMLECKTCHTDKKMSQIDMGDTCGQDCFACHSVQKLNSPKLASAHQVIKQCIACHQSLESRPQILEKSIFLHQAPSPLLPQK
ncbi:hypothetical protein BKH46_05705 [Helicobacter sp. 12S02634-8]|nr:hypothetical protein BKH46_05705 [Helicobacter sp. 12S02634-8]